MPRKGPAPRRELMPDPIYRSVLVTQIANKVLLDGKRDVLVPGSGNYWHRLRHTSSGTYAYNSLGVINPAPPGGLIAADIDGDGRDDLVYVKPAGDAIYWRRNQTVTSSSRSIYGISTSIPSSGNNDRSS